MPLAPHAIFTRQQHGVAVTIEVNPAEVFGWRIRGEDRIPIATTLRISKGTVPGWMYAAGLDAPHWHTPYRYAYAGSDSYITTLRRAVAWLTGGTVSGTPKLGFHATYRARQRAARKA